MSGIGLCNKAITAVDTSERIKLSLALKERDKNKICTTMCWGPKRRGKHLGRENHYLTYKQSPHFLCMAGQVHPLCVISGGRIKEINGQIPGAA